MGPTESPPLVSKEGQLPLLRVCLLLNETGALYWVCGAQACILRGLVRTTEDVDILVQATEENCQRVIDALGRLEDGAARELTPRDILENVEVKVADEVEVDISTKAWKISYEDAIANARETLTPWHTNCLYTDNAAFCDACASKHECGEEMLSPIVDSPRTGVCGYIGPSIEP